MATKTKKQHRFYHSEPLRGEREIDEFINALKIYSKRNGTAAKNYDRNYLLFMLGINTGLRMHDLVALRVRDVNQPVNYIIESKTQKQRMLALSPDMQRLITKYVNQHYLLPDDYLFESRQKDAHGNYSHVTVSTIYKLFKAVGALLGRDDITAHSLRRTYGFNYYMRTHDVATLQRIFNHQSPNTTMHYIGINKYEEQQAQQTFSLGFHHDNY